MNIATYIIIIYVLTCMYSKIILKAYAQGYMLKYLCTYQNHNKVPFSYKIKVVLHNCATWLFCKL